MTIGERLEEARKKKGISVREAAEATKIRGDFLVNMENNSMEIPLPDIYVRGFLKNYANYLKLDVTQIMTDYDAMQLGKQKMQKREKGEFLGRMDLPEKDGQGAENAITQFDRDSSSNEFEDPTDRKLYTNMAIIVVVVFVSIFIVVSGILWLFSKGDKPEINRDLSGSATSVQRPVTYNDDGDALVEEEVTLHAINDVTVVVQQLNDQTFLFKDIMSKGQTVTLKKVGAVRIQYSSGKYLEIERNGEKMTINDEGMGKFILE